MPLLHSARFFAPRSGRGGGFFVSRWRRGNGRATKGSDATMKILTGNSNRPLAEAISAYLNLPLTKASVRRFSDMEVFVEILENVRGEDVFVIQSTSYPANDNLMELLVTIDALQRGSARRITAVMPYYGYARQDRKSGPRTPISAKLVANLITMAGADRVLTLDLHAGQIQGFFDIPTDNLFAAPVFVQGHQGALQRREQPRHRVARCRRRGARPRHRQAAGRRSGHHRQAARAGRRVRGDEHHRRRRRPRCILVDDIVDCGGTLCNAAVALMEEGAESVSAYVTHGVLSGGAVARVSASPLEVAGHHRQHPGDRGRARVAQRSAS